MKIKHAKYFVRCMSTYTKFNRLSLATKIRLRENFTSEIFYWRKYPDLRYVIVVTVQGTTLYVKLVADSNNFQCTLTTRIMTLYNVLALSV